MQQRNVVLEARFDEKLKTYWVLQGALICVVCIVTIPLLPVWLVLGPVWARKYYNSLSCVLTERALVIKRGVWFRTHKTIPLNKITDTAVIEGPLLNWLGICVIRVETPGHSGKDAADLQLVGVIDALAFRDRVMGEAENLPDPESVDAEESAPVREATVHSDSAVTELLAEIRDSLRAIESKLDDRRP